MDEKKFTHVRLKVIFMLGRSSTQFAKTIFWSHIFDEWFEFMLSFTHIRVVVSDDSFTHIHVVVLDEYSVLFEGREDMNGPYVKLDEFCVCLFNGSAVFILSKEQS